MARLRPGTLGLAALLAAPSIGAGFPMVSFFGTGLTYDPATLAVYSDTEGTHRIEGGELGGIALTATATRLTDSDSEVYLNSGPGVGVLPLKVGSLCEIGPGMPLIGKNPKGYSAPRKNGLWARVPWIAVGCGNGTTWRVADGVTTYTVTNLRRVVRPAVYRTIWDDQNNGDDFFNTCLSADYVSSIRQSGGRRYCKVLVREGVNRTTYSLNQRTTITKVYPAYVS